MPAGGPALDLAALIGQLDAIRNQLELVQLARQLPPVDPAAQLVTLDQCAAMVHRSKLTLEHYRGRMPAPARKGHRGQPHLYSWAAIRPWLESTFHTDLPVEFPGYLIGR
jgi:hypothetical protein